MVCGYNGAALPLWEEFLLRFFPFQTQLQAVVPVAEISAHLAELAQLYEAPSPLLSNMCVPHNHYVRQYVLDLATYAPHSVGSTDWSH